jgi:acyl-CoA reductase-like NAD-dependent aldehyde dehydrogenase
MATKTKAKAKSKAAIQKKKQPRLPSGENEKKESGTPFPGKLSVLKTYKIYIDGKFPRTESGRYYSLKNEEGELIANVSRSSRKDFREAVVAARKAQPAWAGKPSLTRGQIIYRIAEMMEGRAAQFIEELILQGVDAEKAEEEVFASIDRCVYYAGWADKYQQIFSSVNSVASSHFNFSVAEPQGVISVFAPEDSGLLGLVSVVIPAITGGNTVVALASRNLPLCAITFAEVLHSSDVPAGVVNIMTGYREELLSHFSTHMDVNAILIGGGNDTMKQTLELNSTSNLKRTHIMNVKSWLSEEAQGPYYIMDLQETKTTWHPVGI